MITIVILCKCDTEFGNGTSAKCNTILREDIFGTNDFNLNGYHRLKGSKIFDLLFANPIWTDVHILLQPLEYIVFLRIFIKVTTFLGPIIQIIYR